MIYLFLMIDDGQIVCSQSFNGMLLEEVEAVHNGGVVLAVGGG